MIYRQGDVMLIGVEAIPETAKELERTSGHIQLARGSSTGHTHLLMQAKAFEDGEHVYVLVEHDTSPLVHEEHATIHIVPGSYLVARQLEWDGQSRQVED